MYKLRNYMEDLVAKKTDGLLEIMNTCKCEKCRLDIMAIALNELPARYTVTDKGELYTKINEMESQFDVDVEMAVVKAVLSVNKSPKHDNLSTQE